MNAIRKQHLRLLEPYLASDEPAIRGEDRHRELDMYCPLHEDTTRSATLDLDKGLWYCHAGCGGGRVVQLVRQQDEWVAPPTNGARSGGGRSRSSSNGRPAEEITEARVKGWVSSLMSSPQQLDRLMDARGLDEDTIAAYEIGWDRDRQAYTIPVRNDNGGFWNLRRYQLEPKDDRRKIWSVSGMGSPPRLYPFSILTDDDPEEIIICEGEWDALLTIQMGFFAVTRTASATTWLAEWGEFFHGKKVYLCHDRDETGKQADQKVMQLLRNVCDVSVIELPYERTKNHGKDLTDYWLEGHTPEDFQKLMDDSRKEAPDAEITELDPGDATILDTFDSRRAGKPLRVTVTIKGVRAPGYTIPKEFSLACTRDAGQKCNYCPLNAAGGAADVPVKPNDPVVLELMDSTKAQVMDVARRAYGIPKCSKLKTDVEEHQAVEILYGRPSVDHTSGESGEYKNLKITSVGRHDTSSNNTVRVVGSLHPDPRKQTNEFLAWEVEPIRTSLDSYELDSDDKDKLKVFCPDKGQRPLKKLGDIARDLSTHVTKIYGRAEMHAAMDLVFHSVLAFDFAGQRIDRGWLEGLFVGDSRTGKSEVAKGLVKHYSAGEVLVCESATIAGIIGGLQQYGGNKEWAITWGAVPINDRRLVVLDEVSGLSPDEIAQMSDVRSRGVAQLTKIQQEATHARTRLIWIGNPRNAGMANFTYGAQAIKPLIGNPEDIARFDLAMSASAGEVSADEINSLHVEGDQKYTADACTTLIRWVWSRKPENVKWAKGAEAAVLEAAKALGRRYVEDPPLVQVANVRIKVARLAVALAARLYSSPDGETLLVKRAHVEDAVAFLDRIYGMPGFGYAELSNEKIKDKQEARSKRDEIAKWLRGRPGMAKFLRQSSTFRRQDLEEIMNMSREEANAVINTLWNARMVSKDRGDVKVEPALHELLRETVQ